MWIWHEHLNRVLWLFASFVRGRAHVRFSFPPYKLSCALCNLLPCPLVIEYSFYLLDSASSSLLSLFSQGHLGPKEKSTRLLVPWPFNWSSDPFILLNIFSPWEPTGLATLPLFSVAPHCSPQDAGLICAGDRLGWKCSRGQKYATHPSPTTHIRGCKTTLSPPRLCPSVTNPQNVGGSPCLVWNLLILSCLGS